MAAGLLVVIVIFILFFIFLHISRISAIHLNSICIAITSFLLFVILHGTFNFIVYNSFDFSRFLNTFLYLIIFLVGALSMVLLVSSLPGHRIDRAVRFVAYVLILIGMVGVGGFSIFFNGDKSVVFYGEPSHFALSFLPFLFYMVVLSALKKKLAFIFTGLLLAGLLNSLILMVGVAFIAACALPFRLLICSAFIVTLIQVVFAPLKIEYFLERLDFSQKVQQTNLSTLVYLQGWETAYLNVLETSGIGVGFQQFGIVGMPGEIASEVTRQAGMPLNTLDGSFVAAKLVGEFGIFSIIMLLIYFYYFIKIAKGLREISLKGLVYDNYLKVFYHSCYVLFVVDLFARGLSYFSSSGFIFVSSLIWLSLFNAKKIGADNG